MKYLILIQNILLASDISAVLIKPANALFQNMTPSLHSQSEHSCCWQPVTKPQTFYFFKKLGNEALGFVGCSSFVWQPVTDVSKRPTGSHFKQFPERRQPTTDKHCVISQRTKGSNTQQWKPEALNLWTCSQLDKCRTLAVVSPLGLWTLSLDGVRYYVKHCFKQILWINPLRTTRICLI
jgi:hypothetical protein